jgi:hypothetical protein
MNGRGFFQVDRGVWSHPVFASEAFTEREAWLWLIARAAWKPNGVRVGQLLVHVERGQLAVSSRYLAEAWRWGKSSVARFLTKLNDAGMIEARHGRDATVITLRNYEKYQLGGVAPVAENDGPPSGTPNGTPNGAPFFAVTHCDGEAIRVDPQIDGAPNGAPDGPPSGTNKKTLKNKERECDAGASASSRQKSIQRPSYSAEFEAFWSAYPKTETANPKSEAFKVFDRLAEDDRALAVASLAAFKIWIGRQFNGYNAPGAAVWLRQRRWERHAQASAPADPAKTRAQLRVKAECHFRGEWRPGWGPSPGEPGCTIPEDVVAEVARAAGAAWPAIPAGSPARSDTTH